MIVMPGLVDTHRHMWQGILRNVLPNGSLDDYRDVVRRTFGAKYTPDDVYAGDLSSALGAIESGVTCILDWSHIHNSPAHSDAAVKALFDSGARAVFAYGNGQNETGRYWEIATSKLPEDIARLRKQHFSSDDQLVTLYLAAPGGTPEQVLPAFKAARDVGARITIHVGVTPASATGLLERLNAVKALGADTTYVHCCTLNGTEWNLIRDTDLILRSALLRASRRMAISPAEQAATFETPTFGRLLRMGSEISQPFKMRVVDVYPVRADARYFGAAVSPAGGATSAVQAL